MAQFVTAKLPIAVSHPDKIFWPVEGYTKLDLVEYYNAIFPHLAPYVKDRILSLERCPDGMQGECFFQKQKPKGMPPGTPTKRIAHADNPGESTEYVVGGSLITDPALPTWGALRCTRWPAAPVRRGSRTGCVSISIPSPASSATPPAQACTSKRPWIC